MPFEGFVQDQRLGARLRPAKLGMGVNVPPQGGHIVCQRHGFG